VIIFGSAHVIFKKLGYSYDTLPRAPYHPVASENYGVDLPKNMDSGYIKTNSCGFRENGEISKKKTEDYRIVVLGDSVGFGLGLKNGETIPDMIEEAFQTKGINAEAINMCVPSWGTEQYLRRWEMEGVHYNPDKVLVVLCYNDPMDDFFLKKAGESGFSELDVGIMRTRSAISKKNSFLFRLIFEHFSPGVFITIKHYKSLVNEQAEEIWSVVSTEKYEEVLKGFISTLKRITESIGTDKILYLVQAHENHVEKFLGVPHNNYPHYYPVQETLFREKTIEYFDTNNIDYIDGLESVIRWMRLYPNTSLRELYGWFNNRPDGIHYSREGSKALAGSVIEKIAIR
jgi:lysophospholipase L1-like esterase